MSRETEQQVLAANEDFYRAFATRDVETMERLWAKASPVVCIHPGWTILRGRPRVMASWRGILSNASAPAIRCSEATAHVLGDTAFVVCYEAISNARLVATNFFVREEGSWKVVHHQASPLAPAGDAATDDDDEPGTPSGTDPTLN